MVANNGNVTGLSPFNHNAAFATVDYIPHFSIVCLLVITSLVVHSTGMPAIYATEHNVRGTVVSQDYLLPCNVKCGKALSSVRSYFFRLHLSLLSLAYSTTQIYFHIAANHTVAASGRLEESTVVIRQRLSINRLKLNPDKTEIVWCSSAKRCGSFPELLLSVDNVTVQPTQSVRNLAALIRSDLSMAEQIGQGCIFYSIRQLRSVRRSLEHEALLALTVSRVDFCNSVYPGLS